MPTIVAVGTFSMGKGIGLLRGLRPGQRASWGIRVLTVSALAVVAVAGWIAAPAGSAAPLQDPEPTTVSTPTTPEPTPDPAPTPAPAPPPKSKPKATPAPARPQRTSIAPQSVASQSVSRPSTPAATRPVARERSPVRPKQRPRAQARLKAKQRAPVKAKRKAETPVKKIEAKELPSIPDGGVAGASAVSTSPGSEDGLFLLVMMLAILCFAAAAIPWPAVSWRMAYYVTPRQTDLTLLGFILMVAAGFTYVLTRGP